MRQCLRWREEHDGEEKSYGSRGIIIERDTMKTRGDEADVTAHRQFDGMPSTVR